MNFLFKKKKEETSSSKDPVNLEKVHQIINALWGEQRVRQIVRGLKSKIDDLVYEEGVKRKTDLLLYGVDLCLDFFHKSRKENPGGIVGDNLTAFIFYRNYLECVLARDAGIMVISEVYTMFQITRYLSDDLHPYIQVMIKIYDLLDRGIIYLYENTNNVSKDYFPIVAEKIRAFLNGYVDDKTTWNNVGL